MQPSLQSLFSDVAALHDPVLWRAAVAACSRALDSDDVRLHRELDALRHGLSAEAAYALNRALRQANCIVPSVVDGREVWQELLLMPVHLKGVRCQQECLVECPPLEHLGVMERGVEQAFSAAFASVHMLPFAADLRQLEGLDPYQLRLAVLQLATFGESSVLLPAQISAGPDESEGWWFWPLTVQHTTEPLALLNGNAASGLPGWQRTAHLLEEKLSLWSVGLALEGRFTVRPPVSWAEAPEQLLRYRLLAWLSSLQSTASHPWSVQWAFEGHLLRLVAERKSDLERGMELPFRVGMRPVLEDALNKIALKFPGKLQRAYNTVTRVG